MEAWTREGGGRGGQPGRDGTRHMVVEGAAAEGTGQLHWSGLRPVTAGLGPGPQRQEGTALRWASWGLGWGPRASLSKSVLFPRRTPCCLRVQCGDFSLTAEDRCYLRKHGDYVLRDIRKDIRTRGGFSCSLLRHDGLPG